jgi:hypothetical protein
MNAKMGIAWIGPVVLVALSSCNLPMQLPSPTPVDLQTTVDDTSASSPVAVGTGTPSPTATASVTSLPDFTATPSVTPPPSPPVVSVSGNTNCRSGNATVYDLVFVLMVGQTAEVVGRDAYGQYWVIRDPSHPADTCWLWGHYATVTGDSSGLPIATPPPTPTPPPSFTFSYDFWGVGPGYQCFRFDVTNTGSLTWESYAITLHNSAHATTATGSANEFVGYDDWCMSTGSQSDLVPGETGTASVVTHLAYNPAGETFDTTLQLCSQNGLGGTCRSQTISFTP